MQPVSSILLGLAIGLATVDCGTAQTTITLRPGIDIPAIVAAQPEGTIFVFTPGIYRRTTIIPKHRNQFLGQPGVVLTGAIVLNPQPYGKYWVAWEPLRRIRPNNGSLCEDGYPDCRKPDDLYLNDVPLRWAPTLQQLGPGKWFADYDAGMVYLADDPTGKTVELGVTEAAFRGGATQVTIRGMVLEKFASQAQRGAIFAPIEAGAKGWLVEYNEIRLNHSVGLTVHPGMVVRGNRIHTNGQLGAGGTGEDILFEKNEVYGNNYAHYDPNWEAGGAKFARTNRLVARENYVHHNGGPGLWTDIDCLYTTYDRNLVEHNDREGIAHEISYAAVIENNVVRYNGLRRYRWLWGGQILLQNSQNVEVRGNTVTVAPSGGNGIALIQQDRGVGPYGPYLTRNNRIYDNTITYEGERGMSGQVSDHDEKGFQERNNRFDGNLYRFRSNPLRWFWEEEIEWTALQAAGQEARGRIE